MRRSESDALQPFDLMHGFEELDERGSCDATSRRVESDAPVARKARRRDVAATPPITRHNLPKQCDFLHPLRSQLATFRHDVGHAAAAFLAARVRHNAEGA